MAQPAWDPCQYNRFASEREQPFWDLCGLLEPVDNPRVVDLGCGDGRLTAALHERIGARETLGIDSSASMLADARRHETGNLRFAEGDIGAWSGDEADVVFSNAALHWVADHWGLLARCRQSLVPGGQLAFQVPANADHSSHTVSQQLAAEWLGVDAPDDPVAQHVLRPEQYAQLLYELGFSRQHVRLQVYGHLLASPAEVVEWVKGTSLTRLRSSMSTDEYERFIEEYELRLVKELGEEKPFFYPFKRILCWGRLPA